MRCLGFFYKGTAVDSARVENSCWLQKLFKNAIKLFPNNIKSDNTHQGMSISLAQAVSHAVNNLSVFTLESGIDVGQGITVGPGKFVKKNKRRVLNKRRA